MKYVAGFFGAIVLALGLATLIPGSIPVGDTNLALWAPFSLLYAMRGILVLILAIVTIIIGLVAIIRGLLMREGKIAGATAALLLMITAAHVVTLAGRGYDNTELPPDAGVTAVGQGNGDITVLSYNTLGSTTRPADIMPLVDTYGVDVIVLAETGEAEARQLHDLLAAKGLSFAMHSHEVSQYEPDIQSTVVLTSASLGEYVQVDAPETTWASVKIVPASGSGPTIMGVHPIAPSAERQELWRTEIQRVYDQCQAMSNTIMAGDFNSTVDHMAATGNDCTSALDGHVGALGTWPTSTPALLGAPIDNVFTDLPVRGAMVVEVGDSDHRGVIARLQGMK